MIRGESDLRALLERAAPVDPASIRFQAVAARARQLHRRRRGVWAAAGSLSCTIVVLLVVSSRWLSGIRGGPDGSPPAAGLPGGSSLARSVSPVTVTAVAAIAGAVVLVVLVGLFVGRTTALPRPRPAPRRSLATTTRHTLVAATALVGAMTLGGAVAQSVLFACFFTGTAPEVQHAMVLIQGRLGALAAVGGVVSIVMSTVLGARGPLGQLLWPLTLQLGACLTGWAGGPVLGAVIGSPALLQVRLVPAIGVSVGLAVVGFGTAVMSARAVGAAHSSLARSAAGAPGRPVLVAVGLSGLWMTLPELLGLVSIVRRAGSADAVVGYLEAGPGRAVLAVGLLTAVGSWSARPGWRDRSVRRESIGEFVATASAVASAMFLVVAVVDWTLPSSGQSAALALGCWTVTGLSLNRWSQPLI